MKTTAEMPTEIPPQPQLKQPETEQQMDPQPIYDTDEPGYDRLRGKLAIINGGDSGIGKAVAILFAKEGGEVIIAYLDEHNDARQTAAIIKTRYGKEVLLVSTDLRSESANKKLVTQTLAAFGHVNIIVNNAAVQFPQETIENISKEQLRNTFETNIFSSSTW